MDIDRKQSLPANAALVSVLASTSLVLTFAEKLVIATCFGVSSKLDAFLGGRTVPDFVNVLFSTAVYFSIIPVATGIRVERGEQAFRSTLSVFAIPLLGLSSLLSIGGFFNAARLANIMLAGLPEDVMPIAIVSMRILFLTVPFGVLGALLTSVLETMQIFWLSSLGPILRSGITIIALVAFAKALGILTMAWAILAGVGVAFFFQLVVLLKTGFSLRWGNADLLAWRKELQEVGFLLVPALSGMGLYTFYSLIDRAMASRLTAGSISALYYGYSVLLVPHAILNVSFATVLYPSFCALVARASPEALRDSIVKSSRVLLLLSAPIAIGLIIFRVRVIEMFFQRGHFDATATTMSANCLLLYMIGYPTYGFISVYARALMSLRHGKALLLLGCCGILFKVVLNIVFASRLDYAGIALATSLSNLGFALIACFVLSRAIGSVFRKADWQHMSRIALSSIPMAVLFWGFGAVAGQMAQTSVSVITSMIGLGLGLVVYLGAARVVGVNEVDTLWHKLHSLAGCP